MFEPGFYYSIVGIMLILAVIVFFTLYRITAGYGMMYNPNWGPAVNNRIGWVLMETPAFFCMLALWLCSNRAANIAPAVMAAFFELHYFRRSFIFPMLMRGNSKMPVSIMVTGMIFNTINAYMIGGWLFYVSPIDYYTPEWLAGPLFILGSIIFFTGMAINISSDRIVRHLRLPGDTRHYIPRGGMFKYVSSASYFGEFTEWIGFAILTWSLGGLAFAIWTFANLAPRAKSVHLRYCSEFGREYSSLNRKYMIPFIY